MTHPGLWLLLIVALPFVGSLLAWRARGPDHGRWIGVVVSLFVVALLAFNLVALTHLTGHRIDAPPLVEGWRPPFGLDALGGLLALTNAVTAAAVIIGAPRARDECPRVAAVLATEGLILTMIASLDVRLSIAAFIALVVPAYLRQLRRPESADATPLYTLVFVAGALPLLVAVGIIELAPGAGTGVVLGLLIVAIWFRMALVPLHGWVPILTQYGSLGSSVLLVASQSGAYLLVRVGFTYFPDDATLTTWLTIAGTLSALYAGAMALVADDLRRLIGWLSVAQAGLMVIGLGSLSPDGVTGAVVYWISYGTAVTGLALTVWAIEARTGTTRISELGGLVASCPRITVAFAAFSIASVGFPGSLGFVAEDLLVHGVLELRPGVGVLMIVTTALCGIALVRAMFTALLGPVRATAPGDLRPHEAAVVAGLGVIAFGFGLWPRPLLEVIALASRVIHP